MLGYKEGTAIMRETGAGAELEMRVNTWSKANLNGSRRTGSDGEELSARAGTGPPQINLHNFLFFF